MNKKIFSEEYVAPQTSVHEISAEGVLCQSLTEKNAASIEEWDIVQL